MRSNLVELDHLIFHYEKPTYYCVSIDEDKFGEEAERIFLSKDHVEKDGDSFIMSEWYAEKKGVT